MKAQEKAALRASAKEDFLSGMNYRQIALKYGVGIGSVARWAEKDSWDVNGRRHTFYQKPEQEERNVGTGTEQAADASESTQERTEAEVGADFDLLRETALKALKKINDLLDLDEALAPRDIKSITGSLLDLKNQLNALSPRELREQALKLQALRKQAQVEEQAPEPVQVVFVNREWDNAGA